jgi:hypothetical protein
MPVLLNLLLVGLLIGSAGVGGYLLARAHFTATIANRVLAYQSRLARSQREGKQAHKDVARLSEEVVALQDDLARSRDRVQRYEVALFETGSTAGLDTPAHMQAPAPVAEPVVSEQELQQQAAAYVQHVSGYDDFERAGDQDVVPSVQLHEAHQLSRAIA